MEGDVQQEFSDFLRSLGNDGEPTAATDFSALWRALRRALRREIRRRGLWEASPAYLGVTGWPSWTGEAGCEHGWYPGDALDELAAEAYLHIFSTRLESLREQLRRKPNIEGLVHRNVRLVVHEAQRRHDPLGFHLFRLLRAALRRLLNQDRLSIVEGGPRIANRTLFTFGDDPPGDALQGLDDPHEAPLEDPVQRWNDDLFPDLLIARGDERRAVVEQLAEHVAALSDAGVETFRFHRLIATLKADTRTRWLALFRTSQGLDEGTFGELGELVRPVAPDRRILEWDRFVKLARCVTRRLEKLDGQRRTRQHRLKLWRFLEAFAASASAGEITGGEQPWEQADGFPGQVLRADDLPSQRELARLLDIPRGRFPELFDTLGEVVRTCLETLEEPPAGPYRLPASLPLGDGDALRAELLRRTAAAWRPDNRQPQHWHRGWAAAAGFLLGLGFAGLLWWLSAAPPERVSSPPSARLEIDRVVRGGDNQPLLEIPSDSRQAVLVVTLPPRLPPPARFELFALPAADGEPPLLTVPIADPGAFEQVLLIPVEALPPGGLMRLEVRTKETPEPAARYTFRLRRRAAAEDGGSDSSAGGNLRP